LYNETMIDIEMVTDKGPVNIIKPMEGDILKDRSVEVLWTVDGEFTVMNQVLIVDGEEVEIGKDERSVQLNFGDGYHDIQLRCTDNFGMKRSPGVGFLVDGEDPDIEIISPIQDIIYSNKNVKLKWNANDENGLRFSGFRLDTTEWMEMTEEGPYSMEYVLTHGNYTFEVRAVDIAGRETLRTVDFSIGPETSLRITSPESGTVTVHSMVEVEWELLSDFDPVSYEIVNRDLEYVQHFSNMTSIEVPLKENSLNRIGIKAFDVSMNQVSDECDIIRDNIDPVISILNKTEFRNSTTREIEWKANDEYGISGFTIRWDNGDWVETSSSNHIIDEMEDGIHTLEVKCFDNAGNSNDDVYTFELDTTPPVVKLSPVNGNNIAHDPVIKLNWIIHDNIEQGPSILKIGSRDYSFEKGIDTWSGVIDDGLHRIVLVSFDEAGNSAVDSLVLLVDTMDPRIEMDSYPPDLTNIRTLGVNFHVEENVGLGSVQLIHGENILFSDDDAEDHTVLLELNEGVNNIILKAVDMSGRSDMVEFEIVLDSTPPILEGFDHSYLEEELVLYFTIYDPNSGMKEMNLSVNGMDIPLSMDENKKAIGKMDPGTIEVLFLLIDNAGNEIRINETIILNEIEEDKGEENGSFWWIILVFSILVLIAVMIGVLAKRRGNETETLDGSNGSRDRELRSAPLVNKLKEGREKRMLPPLRGQDRRRSQTTGEENKGSKDVRDP